MFWFLLFVLIIVIAIVASIIYSAPQRKKALTEELNNLNDFVVSQSHIGEDGNSAIAVDSINKKICLLIFYGDKVKSRIVSFRDLISAEIFIDGSEAVKTSRTSQSGEAILGGIIAGGIDTVIGGLSESKSSIKKATNIRLRIVINDSLEPIHVVNFLDGEYKTDSLTYRHAEEQARYWQGLLKIFITQADRED